MDKNNYVIETSWEVCNKNGGIYTVLSTHAKALGDILGDHLIFIGPDFGNEDNIYFKENKTALKSWKTAAAKEGLAVRVGTWNVPGNPLVILVNYKPFFTERDAFYGEMWEKFGVNSLGAVGDYHDCAVFSMAAGKVVESFVNFNKCADAGVIAHFHEWQTAAGLLYVKSRCPQIKTAFTTHATTTGRSICFNNKQLYAYFTAYNGDQMAGELCVSNKHSIEKAAAHNADCFTTVSGLTADECKQLLDKPAFVTPNGFEADFVPTGDKFAKARTKARNAMTKVAEALLGYKLKKDALFIATSGRFEWRNKGIDVFMKSLQQLNQNPGLDREVVAFVMVPSWVKCPRTDLQEKLASKGKNQLDWKSCTHEVNEPWNNQILNAIGTFGLYNQADHKVKVIYVPCLLDGNDGIFNMSYYDLLPGLDLTVFASYYEPWGYTPLESVAFGVPTITTDKAGFGLWVMKESKKSDSISNGVAVINRTDFNFDEVASRIENEVVAFSKMKDADVAKASEKAKTFADKASWNNFISYYVEAYDKTLANGVKKAPAKKATSTTKKVETVEQKVETAEKPKRRSCSKKK